MPPKKPRKKSPCSFQDCPEPAEFRSNPPLCFEHAYYDDDEEGDFVVDPTFVDDALDAVLENPRVKSVFNRAGAVFEKFAQVLDRVSQQQSAPPPGKGPRPQSPPPRKPPPKENPREVLGFGPNQLLTEQIVKDRKKALASIVHPDKPGGSVEAMARINAAADALLASLPKS